MGPYIRSECGEPQGDHRDLHNARRLRPVTCMLIVVGRLLLERRTGGGEYAFS
jgi:hypothetical protein